MKNRVLARSASVAAMMVATLAIAAMAQDLVAPQDMTSTGLADIVVTAHKVAENLQDIPVAVTV